MMGRGECWEKRTNAVTPRHFFLWIGGRGVADITPADLSKNTAEQRPLQSCGNDTRGTPGGDTQSLWYERKVLV